MKHPETKMVAIKAIRYKMKRIAAGEEFQARTADVRVLQAVKHAKLAPRELATLPEIPKSLADKVQKQKPAEDHGAVDEIRDLREKYHEIFGKKPFNGWDAATLRDKIEEAQPA